MQHRGRLKGSGWVTKEVYHHPIVPSMLVEEQGEDFAVVFCAMGITNEEAQYFIRDFERTGALKRATVFLNLADDPALRARIARGGYEVFRARLTTEAIADRLAPIIEEAACVSAC